MAAYAACRDPLSASELRRLAEGSDDKLRILAVDVTDAASIHAAAAQLDGHAIDLLLNNAGIIGPRCQAIGNIDYEAWAEVLAVNTMGPMRMSEAFVEHVARSDRKLIVTLTSGMGARQSARHNFLSAVKPQMLGSMPRAGICRDAAQGPLQCPSVMPADIGERIGDVRFGPESGRSQ